MEENWTQKFDFIEECYTPGEALPPVKNEWRHISTKSFWKVTITGAGDKPKKYAPIRSALRPIIKGNVVGIALDLLGDDPRWTFIAFSELIITKYIQKIRYRLVSSDDDGVVVEYKEDDPVAVAEDGDW